MLKFNYFHIQGGNNVGSAPVRVSFLTIHPTASTSQQQQATENIMLNGSVRTLRSLALDADLEHNLDESDSPAYSDSDTSASNDRICFNVGRELYVFVYRYVFCSFFLLAFISTFFSRYTLNHPSFSLIAILEVFKVLSI